MNAALFVDLYELTMLETYFQAGMNETAVFDLFMRRLPPTRNYLVACGLNDVLSYLENFYFTPEAITYLKSLGKFSDEFLDHLRAFHFQGDVYAVPEGTIVFANEPIIEIVAALPEAQLVETFVMNQIHLATMAASKAARVVTSAQGRTVIDFGMRRMHGTDAAMKQARAYYIAGVDGTSNVMAGEVYGIPVSGTMAHSYIQAFDREMDSFRIFLRSYPEATILVDTYDTIQGVRHLIQLARELGVDFKAAAVRLDSGDLTDLAKQTRELLDGAGLQRMKIFASSSLDERAIEALLAAGAPIDGFGVGTHMGTSSDAPYLDAVYKLVEYAGKPKLKTSAEKSSLPGRKQVFRRSQDGRYLEDVIALVGEELDGRPLLTKVMENGRRLHPAKSLAESRALCKSELESLPKPLLELVQADPAYPVRLSSDLMRLRAGVKPA